MNFVSNIVDILLKIFPIIGFYLIILSIIFFVSLFFIFKKCYIKGYYAFVPFFNIYEYMKICHLSWYWGFIPVVNIIVFFTSPYLLGYQFGQKEYVKILGIIFPILFFPYIAFSKATYIHPKIDTLNINSIEDVDRLEKKILMDIENEESFEGITENKKVVKKKDISNLQPSHKEILLDQLDKNYCNLTNGDIIVDDIAIVAPDIKQEQNIIYKDDDFVELNDYKYDSNIDSIESLSEIEKIAIQSGTEVSIDNNDYKEIKEEQKSNEEIAFAQREKRQLVCPKCGSSLIGATNICPGCGMDLKQLT